MKYFNPKPRTKSDVKKYKASHMTNDGKTSYCSKGLKYHGSFEIGDEPTHPICKLCKNSEPLAMLSEKTKEKLYQELKDKVEHEKVIAKKYGLRINLIRYFKWKKGLYKYKKIKNKAPGYDDNSYMKSPFRGVLKRKEFDFDGLKTKGCNGDCDCCTLINDKELFKNICTNYNHI